MERIKIYEIHGELERIESALSNLEYFGQLHPLIFKVEKLDFNTKNETFRIFERPFSWLPISIKYKVQVAKRTGSSTEFFISEIPFTTAKIKYQFSEKPKNIVEIKLSIQIVNKFIGKRILMNKMIGAQDKIMNSLHTQSPSEYSA